MSYQREPNPLRPYYTPPSTAHGPSVGANPASPPNVTSSSASASTNTLGTSARNILADIDYSDYIRDQSPGAKDVFWGLFEQMLWKYASVFLAQPFEVTKVLLQVQSGSARPKGLDFEQSRQGRRGSQATYRRESLDVNSSDEEPDFNSYFTSSAPLAHTPTHAPRGRRRRVSLSPDGIPRKHPPRSPPKKPPSVHQLDLKTSSSVLSALSSLWNAEGAWGIWKGTNSTFVYSVLLATVNSFLRSFLSAVFALPDSGLSFNLTPSGPGTYTGGLDILSSASPLSSLAIAVSAAGIASTILAPLDMARTRLMVTPSTHPPRSIISTLKSLPCWTLPFSLAPTSILHSTLPTFISASTPLFLRSKLGIDPLLTPNLYSVATFCSQAVELGVKLPLETVLRRGQISIAQQHRPTELIVGLGAYKGLFGTMHAVIYEEGEKTAEPPKGAKGSSEPETSKIGRTKRKGQGAEGLYRGWRVGMWGLVGVWGAAVLGGAGAKGGEF